MSKLTHPSQTNGSDIWRTRVTGLMNRTISVFFPGGIAVEVACELNATVQCTTDELSFKGYLHRWMASTTQLAPFTHATIMATLLTSATGAVKACSGGAEGRQCGFRWNTGAYDGDTGAGQEMSALAALSSLLIDEVDAPVTTHTGGTSVGDPSAGQDPDVEPTFAAITAGDKAGATFLTVFVVVMLVGLQTWMNTGMSEGGKTVRLKGQ